MKRFKEVLSVLVSTILLATFGSADGLAGEFDRAADHARRVGHLADLNRGAAGLTVTASSSVAAGPDIRVSQISAPAQFVQDRPSLARTRNGQWLAAWQDDRFGSSKIMVQRLDSLGNLVGGNQLLLGSPVGAEYVDPEIAVDTSGRVFLFYRDRTNGLIFGARYTSALALDLPSFLVNDTTGAAFAGLFDIDLYPDGRLVVAWEEYDLTGNTIHFRIYGPSGAPIGASQLVHSNSGATAHWSPKVAVQPNSGFVIAWEDYRSGNADVYLRQFSGAGIPVAAEFTPVPPAVADSSQYAPAVDYSPTAQYVIGWLDRRTGLEVMLQRFDPVSGLQGSNVLASAQDTSYNAWDLDLAVAPNGTVLAAWASYGPQIAIVGRRLNQTLAPLSSILELSQSPTGRRWSPSVEFFSPNRIGLSWTELADQDADISFMQFDSTGARHMAAIQTLNDDTQGTTASSPYIFNVGDWHDIVLFTDRRRDAGDMFAQLVANNGIITGSNRRINSDAPGNLQTDPSGAAGPTANLAVWVDGRALTGVPGQRIFGRFLSDLAVPTSAEFVISDSTLGDGKLSPKAAIASTGRTLVAWLDRRGNSPQVYGRWLTSSGQHDGAEFLISLPVQDSQIVTVTVARDLSNRFYVLWLDNGRTTPRVRGLWYNADKSLGGNYVYTSTVSGATIHELSAAIPDTGAIALLWTTAGTAVKELYLTVINRAGIEVNPATLVTSHADAYPSEPSLDICAQNFFSMAWIDGRSGRRLLYHSIYTDQMTPLITEQPFSSASPEYMREPSVAAERGRLWIAWVDPRQDGAAVWANTWLYLPTDVIDDRTGLPSTVTLFQNYPNPFNPRTVIHFSLPTRAHVRLTVLNLLGQTVAELAQGEWPAGTHRLEWNGRTSLGREAASGIYFYRLDSGEFSRTKKMLLVR